MIVTLTPQAEALIRERIERGDARSAETLIEDALEALRDRETLDNLRAAIASGDAQYAAGKVKTWTPETIERLKQEAMANVQNGKPIKDDVKP